jgi:hypothetical protein
MNIDPEMLKALADDPFPILGIARLMDALMAELQQLDPSQRAARAQHFLDVFASIKNLSNAYTRVVQSRTSEHFVN